MESMSQLLGMYSFVNASQNSLFLSDNDLNLMMGMERGAVMAQLPEFEIDGSFSMQLQKGLAISEEDSGIF